MKRDVYPYPDHKNLLSGDLLACPFCGEKPYIESCDRLIVIGCSSCDYYMHSNGFVQSLFETKVVASKEKVTGRPIEWYDKDAFEKAESKWNRRMT